MPDGYKPARPFFGESEIDNFQCLFCDRCEKGVECKAQKLVDAGAWPVGDGVVMDSHGRHVCLDFFSAEKELMWFYEKAFPQTYLGFKLRNTADGCMAESDDGLWSLTCGCKANLETQLLVSFPSRAQSAVISVTEGNHERADTF